MTAAPQPSTTSPSPAPSCTQVRFGPFLLDAAEARLLRDGQPVDIAPKPYALLAFLAARPGVLVSKEELLDGVWGHRFVSDSVLKVAMSGLRQALGDDAKAPRWIHTVSRRGYRFSDGVDGGEAPADEPADEVLADAVSASAAPAPAATEAAAARPRPAARGNLPPAGEALLGREADMQRLLSALQAHRLVTITGPGGVGKTRLALAAAAAAVPPDGGWLLRLDTVDSSQRLGETLARTLGLGDAAAAQDRVLCSTLASLDLLLVLDNAEHLAESLAPLLAGWMNAAPRVRVLVTSQRPLRLAQEQLLPLAPLAVPPPHADAAALAASPAVLLLLQRVQATAPHWVPDAADLAEVAAITRELDGLPLALELAAARVPLLGAAGVRQRLDARLQLLTRGAADAPDRHRTLRSALEWSVSLLPQATCRVLERLSVFAGGFTLEAARAVAVEALPDADEWAVLDALELLRDMALVVDAVPAAQDALRPGARLRLYDSVRLLAAERLARRGDTGAAERAHLRWVGQCMDQALQAAGSQPAARWLAAWEPEIENLQVAVQRGLAAAATEPAGLREVVLAVGGAALLCIRAGMKPQLASWLVRVRDLAAAHPAAGLDDAANTRLDVAEGLMTSPGQMLPAQDGLQALERCLAAAGTGSGAWMGKALQAFLVQQLGMVQLRVNPAAALGGTRQRLAALIGPDASPTMRRLLTFLQAVEWRDDLARCGGLWMDMLDDARHHGDEVDIWRAAWGLAQVRYRQDRLDEAIEALDAAVDSVRRAGRLHGQPGLVAHGAMLRLARDASDETLARAREAVAVLCPQDMLWWMADAVAWAPLWQGRVDDALRIQAWADAQMEQRKERRGPVFSKLRDAFAARTAGRPAPDGPPCSEQQALRLAGLA